MRMAAGLKRFRRWLNGSSRRRLFFWSIAFWVVSVTILTMAFMVVGRSQMLDEARSRNVQLASVISREVNAEMGGIIDATRTFQQHLEQIDPALESQAMAMLSLRLSSPEYRAVYYFDTPGHLLFRLADPVENLIPIKTAQDLLARPTTPVNQQVFAAYQSTLQSTLFVSEVQYSQLDYSPVIFIGVPIDLSQNETRIGVFEIDISDIWRRIDLNTVGNTGITYAISAKGMIIAHPNPAYIGKPASTSILPVTANYEGYAEYTDAGSGQQVLAAYSPVLGPTGWGIIVQQDLLEVYSAINRTGALIILIWVVLGAIGTFSIVLLTRNFTRPIKDLTKTAKAIAETGNLTKTGMEQRADEIGQLSAAFDQMIDRLETSEGRVAHAAAEERNRLARDLHDAVSQTLFSASLIADVLPRLWERNPAEARRRLEEVRQLTRGALAEMRTLLLELRPSALVEAEIGHLLTQLGESITGRSRIPVNVTIEGQCSVPNEVKIALYRIAQEALNNVAKHSGASTADVRLTCAADRVTLTVSDDGHGFDVELASNKSLGMGIIRERANEIGAKLSLASKPEEGTRITVVWQAALAPEA